MKNSFHDRLHKYIFHLPYLYYGLVLFNEIFHIRGQVGELKRKENIINKRSSPV